MDIIVILNDTQKNIIVNIIKSPIKGIRLVVLSGGVSSVV